MASFRKVIRKQLKFFPFVLLFVFLTYFVNRNFDVVDFDLRRGTVDPDPHPLRVICVLLKDEGKYLKEWLDFHIAAGWNKIVIFDDYSTDNILEILKPYRNTIHYIHARKHDKVLRPEVHTAGPLQGVVYKECFELYWKRAEALGTFDVDEFFFPARELWGKASDEFIAAIKVETANYTGRAVVLQTECFKYGFNGFLITPEAGIKNYPLRAP
jgi:hypothetical protein